MNKSSMEKRNFYNLSVITKRIQHYLQPAIGKSVWVKAEISSGRERGGSFYCNLVETDTTGRILAKINCTIWSRDLLRIRKNFQDQNIELKLDDGTSVGFQCSVQYNPQYGLSLKVEDADPAFALGELELKKREILNRLAKEGLFEKNKQLFVPMLPQRIGLITSKGSAAYNDFIETLHNSSYGFQIILFDSNMQGNQTENSILQALDTLEKLSVELIIIIRGGGSKTDLYSLDNEKIARKIADCKLPVWTGIGHEIDTSVLDHVSSTFFKTPTAVSEELVAKFVEMDRHLNESKNRFQSTWNYRFIKEKTLVDNAKTGILSGTRKFLDTLKISLKNYANQLSVEVNSRLSSEIKKVSISKSIITSLPINIISRQKDHLNNHRVRFNIDRFQKRISNEQKNTNHQKDQLTRLFNIWVNNFNRDIGYFKLRFNKANILSRIKNERMNIRTKKVTLKAYDPKTSLKRGFSLVYNKKGKLLKSITEISRNETITTELNDGKLTSTIEKIEEKKNGRS